MQTYDLIAIGTGSAMNIVAPYLQMHPEARVAVIDRDPPGGICLTKGCIPTKLLLYPAEVLRTAEAAADLGIRLTVEAVDFPGTMARMRDTVARDVESIRAGLTAADNIDYYPATAEYNGDGTLTVSGRTITSETVLLCTGSRPLIPPIEGLEETGYLTSDTVLAMETLPRSLVIIGGGYIAAEYGHFFSAMGAKVAIVGRNPRFLPHEEPEVSAAAQAAGARWMTILTNHEVRRVETISAGKKKVVARDAVTGAEKRIIADEILVAVGRGPTTDLLQPERAGIETDADGWIRVNDHLETTRPGTWAFGDAIGRHLFKHVANYESKVVFYNAILGERVRVSYHAVPHAVFIHPEVASLGMGQADAEARFGRADILIGHQRFSDTAKGMAMGERDGFVKVIAQRDTERILGAHIIGPHAAILIQELVTLMYTPEANLIPITEGMHIHPALSEVVERACGNLMPVDDYNLMVEHGH